MSHESNRLDPSVDPFFKTPEDDAAAQAAEYAARDEELAQQDADTARRLQGYKLSNPSTEPPVPYKSEAEKLEQSQRAAEVRRLIRKLNDRPDDQE